jgi:hypothetical protein
MGKNCGNLGKKSNIKSAEIWENNAEIWQLQDLLAEIWQLLSFFILRNYECHPYYLSKSVLALFSQLT